MAPLAADKATQTEGKATPAELAEREREALERELAGRLARKAELEQMGSVAPEVLEQVEGEIKAARAALGAVKKPGQKSAAKRPRSSTTKNKETRG